MPTTVRLRTRALRQIENRRRNYDADRIVDQNLLVMVLFVVIGLLITMNIAVRFPDLGALIEGYNQF
jgi:predicted histidine transporter YuiF (NhaC family)